MSLKTLMTAYWNDVLTILVEEHGAKRREAQQAIAAMRKQFVGLESATLHREPSHYAQTILNHGLIPSLPATGLRLALVFTLTDQALLKSPESLAKAAHGLIADLSDYEQKLGGDGLVIDGQEALMGKVHITLKPKNAVGARKRLEAVREALLKGVDQTLATLKGTEQMDSYLVNIAA
jgi:hypothetical protein